MDAQRGHEIGAVYGHRIYAQVENRGDFLVRVSLGDQFQNLLFARRKAFVVRIGLAVGTSSGGMRCAEVAFSQLRKTAVRAGGDVDAGVFIERIPLAVDRALLERGRERFDISCAPCHGTIGDGSSVIAQKMSLRPPPSLLGDSVRAAADGKLEEVVRVGWGTMAGYESQLTSRDRWAVVAYVRALQLSQRAPLDLAPADERQRLAAEPAP